MVYPASGTGSLNEAIVKVAYAWVYRNSFLPT